MIECKNCEYWVRSKSAKTMGDCRKNAPVVMKESCEDSWPISDEGHGCWEGLECNPKTGDYVDIVFDGPPEHESGRFVEAENSDGASISIGKWVMRDDGYWALRIPDPRSRAMNCRHCGLYLGYMEPSQACPRCGTEREMDKQEAKAGNFRNLQWKL